MDPLPPDPYLALNIAKDAPQAQIKSSYRKLALKYHPDKAPDKGDEFHKISVAYELIGEEEARQKYDADVRLHALKKEQMARFGTTYRTDPGVRAASYDVRGSHRPDFQFQARTAPRFEERRPGAGFSSARASPYVRDDGPDYFSPKYEDVQRRATAPKGPPREEVRKTESKKGKPDSKPNSKQRVHEEAKRQRHQDRGYDRKAKAKVAPSVYSDSDDDSDSDVTPRKENSREDAYVRPKEYKKSDDDYYGRTKRPELGRKSYAEDYIRSSRVDPPPAERGAPPPPAYVRKNTRSPSPPPRRSKGESNTTKGRAPDLRPEVVRRSSARPAERERSSTPEATRPSRPIPSRRTSGRRSPSPERNVPPKPKLYHAATQPNNIKVPSADVDPRSDRAQTQDAYREETRVPPHLRRTETAPSKSSPLQPPKRPAATPMQSNAPVQSSGLRKMETNEDSGYNTSSPSEDSPQPPQKASYRYSQDDEKSGRYFRETTRSPERERDYERERDRDRELPRRPTMGKERASGPPPSRSASYALNDRTSDPEARQSPSSSRRPSLQHEDLGRRANSTRDELPRLATRHRSESHKSPRIPEMQTGSESPRERNRADRPSLFGEIPQARSPVNLTSSDSEYDEVRRGNGKERTRDGGERERRPQMEQTRSYRKVMNNVDSGYASYGPPQQQGRRASEDVEKSRLDGANRYMEENTRPSMRRHATSTYAN